MATQGRDDLELTQPASQVLRRILSMAGPYRAYILGGITLGLFIAAFMVVQPLIEGEGIQKLLEAFETGRFTWETLRPLLLVLGMLAALGVARLVAEYNNRMLLAHLRMKILTDLRRRVYRKLIRQSFAYYDRQDTGQLINRTIGDVNNLRMFYTMVLVSGSETLFTIACFLVAVFAKDRWVGMVALPFVPVYAGAMLIFARYLHPLFHDMRHQLDRSTEILSENVQGIQVVRAFGREREETSRYESTVRAIFNRWLRLARAFSIYQPTVFFIGEALMLAMVAMSAYRVFYGDVNPALIYIVYRWARMLMGRMRMIARMTGAVQHSLVSAERVFEILDARPDIRPPGKPRPMPEGEGRVVFDDVTFGYDPDQPVLEDINLDIPAGTNVALVGPTGSGKSSLIKLLARFYDPQEGEIRIDGTGIRDLDLEELRAEIGFVFQDTFLFSTSLADNIAFGVPEAERKAIEEAGRRARVAEFAEAFSDGYDTAVGERGISLSGGQRQRVAIARALLVDPRILILDDATASVDSSTERAIQENLAEVMENRTTFIIAHRASTVKRADRVLVIENGRIVEQGPHEELIARDGPYRRFCEMQWKLGIDDEALEEMR